MLQAKEHKVNEANQISASTKLFGFIAEKAQSDRFSVTLNKTFKARGDDAMIIPMNIREDDLYFTVANMRSSQLRGAAIGVEYQKAVVEILDAPDALVEACGYCDTIRIIEGKLHGTIRSADALLAYLRGEGAARVAVIGGGSLAKSLALRGGDLELHFYHESVEALMEMSERIGTEVDVNRIAAGMTVDLSGYDAVVDACRMAFLEMITALPRCCVDLKASDAPSALRQRCNELNVPYAGYDTLLPTLTEAAYDIWMKE
jgi:shikimate 5-dehydrogenase